MSQNQKKQRNDSSRREFDPSRRRFFKSVGKAAYVAPIILTLQATPSFANHGSLCEPFINDPNFYDKCERKYH